MCRKASRNVGRGAAAVVEATIVAQVRRSGSTAASRGSRPSPGTDAGHALADKGVVDWLPKGSSVVGHQAAPPRVVCQHGETRRCGAVARKRAAPPSWKLEEDDWRRLGTTCHNALWRLNENGWRWWLVAGGLEPVGLGVTSRAVAAVYKWCGVTGSGAIGSKTT